MKMGPVKPQSESASMCRMNDSGAWVGHSIESRPMPEYANQKLKDVVRGSEEEAERGKEGEDSGVTIDRKNIEEHRKDLIR
jgi:hypothetical protein